jgi:hypothetical protein
MPGYNLQRRGTARTSQICLFVCYVCMFHSLCSVYCLCVNVHCTAATGCQPNCSYIYRVAQKMYTPFTHQYLWNKSVPGSNTSWLLPMGVPKGWCLSAETSYAGWSRENIAMLCVAITLDTLQNIVCTAVQWLGQCLDADGGHLEHLLWIQNSRTSLISILILYKYSSYDYRVIFLMSNCVYILLGHPVYYFMMDETMNLKCQTKFSPPGLCYRFDLDSLLLALQFQGNPNSMTIWHKTSVLTES